MIHVSRHAIERFQERVRNVPDEDAIAALSCHAVQIAADFGAPAVKLGTGHHVMLHGHWVITVLPAWAKPDYIFRWGKIQ